MSDVIPDAIVFIAVLIAAGGLAGAITAIGSDLGSDTRARGETRAHDIATHITIINDPADVTVSPALVVYIKNTGDTTLDTGRLDLVINGVVSSDLSRDVLGSNDDETWPAGRVVQVTVNDIALGSGDHRVRATIGNAASDVLTWSAP